MNQILSRRTHWVSEIFGTLFYPRKIVERGFLKIAASKRLHCFEWCNLHETKATQVA
jgi:hypothetical protein